MAREAVRSTRRLIIGAIVFVVALVGALILWARSRPPFDARELAEAEARVAAAQVALADADCTRPPLIQGAGPVEISPAQLIDVRGPFASCLTETTRSDPDDALGETTASADNLRRWVGTEEPATFRQACAGLADAVFRLAASEGSCSPMGPTSPRWNEIHIEVKHVAMAIATIARGMARAGDLEGALTLLVGGAVVMQDLRRGPTSVVFAAVSVVGEQRLWSAFNSLLVAAAAPDDVTLSRLAALLDRVLDTTPHAHDIFASEALAVIETARGLPDERAVAVMLAATQIESVERWCPRSVGATECFVGMPAPVAPTEPSFFEALRHFIEGPRAKARWALPRLLADLESFWPGYYARLLSSPSSIHAIRVLVALAGSTRDGSCPTDAPLDANLLEVPFATGPIEIRPLGGLDYAVMSPPPAVAPHAGPKAFLAVCPSVIP